jgi:hypothetical protein
MRGIVKQTLNKAILGGYRANAIFNVSTFCYVLWQFSLAKDGTDIFFMKKCFFFVGI